MLILWSIKFPILSRSLVSYSLLLFKHLVSLSEVQYSILVSTVFVFLVSGVSSLYEEHFAF